MSLVGGGGEAFGKTVSSVHGARRLSIVTLVFISLFVIWTTLGSTVAFASTEYLDLAAEDVYQTAVQISKAGFGPGVEAVVVADGDNALAAGAAAVLASSYGGPLLLTSGESLDPRVGEEIWRLGPDWIFVIGAKPSIAADVARTFPEVASSGRVVMLCGSDVVDTALLVAQQVAERTQEAQGVVLLSEEYASAATSVVVAASSLAAGKCWPLLFVPASGALPENSAAVIEGLAPRVVVRVQTSVEVSGAGETIDLKGGDRYEVGYRLGEYAAASGFSYAHLAIVSGEKGSDWYGLTVGPYLARTQGIVVISSTDEMPTDTVAVLIGPAGSAARVDFCGLSVVGQERVRLVLDETGLPNGFGKTILKQSSEGSEVAWLEQRLADLSYRPGSVDGVFDKRTRMAVIAFQKWEGLSRDGIVGPEVWWRLLNAERPTPLYAEEGSQNAPDGKWIEVDKDKQVLLYCVEGVVERTVAVSTGSPGVGVATPSGIYFVRRENTYERVRYKPLYLSSRTLLAIHGYTSVPTYPASHGCIRMTWADMDELHDLIPVGTPVLVY